MTENGVIHVPQVDLLDFGRRLRKTESSENDVSDRGSDVATTVPWLRATATHLHRPGLRSSCRRFAPLRQGAPAIPDSLTLFLHVQAAALLNARRHL
jgi:hypothetical protein